MLVVASCVFAAFAERQSTSLAGDWHYIVDPQNIGSLGYHDDPDSHRDNMWFGRNAHAKKRSDLVDCNFSASPTMKVPGDWNTQVKELFWYEGIVWYETEFDGAIAGRDKPTADASAEQASPSNRIFLVLDGVSLKADVYMNGRKLGSHVCGFTQFE